MTSFTTPATWSAATLTAAQLNEQLRDNTKNVDERLVTAGILSSTKLNQVRSALVGVRATASGNQTISADTDTTVTWDTEAYDSDAFHSTASNTSRITIPSGMDGYYWVTVTVRWFGGPYSAPVHLWVEDDGGNAEGRVIHEMGDLGDGYMSLSFVTNALAAGDYLVARVRQGQVGSQILDKDATGCGFTAWRLFST